jgi:hypothetical protein
MGYRGFNTPCCGSTGMFVAVCAVPIRACSRAPYRPSSLGEGARWSCTEKEGGHSGEGLHADDGGGRIGHSQGSTGRCVLPARRSGLAPDHSRGVGRMVGDDRLRGLLPARPERQDIQHVRITKDNPSRNRHRNTTRSSHYISGLRVERTSRNGFARLRCAAGKRRNTETSRGP